HRQEGAAPREARRPRAREGGTRDRLADGGEAVFEHGIAAATSVGTVAREDPAVFWIPPGWLGDERVLVAAPQEIHCNRDGRSGVFPAGDARRYRPRGRVGTSPDPRDRRTTTVLRSGSEEIVSCGLTAYRASEWPSSKIARNSGRSPLRFPEPDRRSGSRIPMRRSRRNSSATRGGRTHALA